MKPLLSDKANELIVQTIKNIKENESLFDMDDWAICSGNYIPPGEFVELMPEDNQKLHTCDTSMCFAGWILYTYREMYGKKEFEKIAALEYPMAYASYPSLALRALGFDAYKANEYRNLYWRKLRKNSSDVAQRISSVFMDKSIKTPKELEDRLLTYKLLRYESYTTLQETIH